MMALRTLHIFSILLLFLSTFTAAWPWPRWLPDVDALIVRRDTSTSQNESSSTGSSSSQTQSGSKSQSATSGSQSSSTSAPHTTSFAASLPAGGITLITPSVAAGPQYYKVGNNITFAWNFTDVLATPTAVDILATCTANQQMYTLAMNHTVGANSTAAVTWDTEQYQATAAQDPLLTEMYTLIIYDAASGISATAQPGYLAVYDQYTFGMYTPQPYTPLPEYKCLTCSGALSDMERRALTTVFGMGIITVLTFTWFVGGLGVIW